MQTEQEGYGVPKQALTRFSEIEIQNVTGGGSTTGFTGVLIFGSILNSQGAAITYRTSAGFGDSLTINETGYYSIYCRIGSTTSSASQVAVMKNSASSSFTAADTNMLVWARSGSVSGTPILTGARTVFLLQGDILRMVGAAIVADGIGLFAVCKVR